MYQFKVDSCRLSIPLRQCEILNKELQDHFTDIRINKTTGETTQIKSYSGIPYKFQYDDGTSVKIWIDKQISYNKETKQRYSEEYIILLANSKHLKQHYFKGITKDTIKLHYEFIMALDVFKCSFDNYSKARYSDIDICFDFECSEDNFSILEENILRSALEPLHFHTSNKDDNSGIWTPTRKDPRKQATPKKPFIKFYSKELDFLHNSTQFAKAYFKHKDFKDLIRFECTVKNNAHKRRLGINKMPTFIEFLNSDLQLLGKQIFSEYFKKTKFVKSTDLKPMDKVVIDLINMNIDLGATKTQIQNLFDRYDVNPKARQRLLKKYHELYSNETINKKKLEANQISRNVFEFLGVDLNQTKIDFKD